MPRSCTVGHFVTCPQGYSCMAPFDGPLGYCCRGAPQPVASDGCPPGEIVYMERNEVVSCDPFNVDNQGCPSSFSCQWSVRTQRYQCCGIDPLPTPLESKSTISIYLLNIQMTVVHPAKSRLWILIQRNQRCAPRPPNPALLDTSASSVMLTSSSNVVEFHLNVPALW